MNGPLYIDYSLRGFNPAEVLLSSSAAVIAGFRDGTPFCVVETAHA